MAIHLPSTRMDVKQEPPSKKQEAFDGAVGDAHNRKVDLALDVTESAEA